MNLPPPYSTSIEAAWQVVEKLCGTYPGVHRRVEVIAIKHGGHVCLVEEGEEGDSKFEVTRHYIATASADTAPLAICLAALAAVGVEVA